MVVGLAADGDVSLPDLDLADGPAGGRRRLRGQGPRPGWSRETCDQLVSIPMAGSSSRSTPASPPASPSTRSRRSALAHAWRPDATAALVGAVLARRRVARRARRGGRRCSLNTQLDRGAREPRRRRAPDARRRRAWSTPGRCCPTCGSATSARSASTLTLGKTTADHRASSCSGTPRSPATRRPIEKVASDITRRGPVRRALRGRGSGCCRSRSGCWWDVTAAVSCSRAARATRHGAARAVAAAGAAAAGVAAVGERRATQVDQGSVAAARRTPCPTSPCRRSSRDSKSRAPVTTQSSG